MGKIFTISGPSGVGKTTFLQQLFKLVDKDELVLIPRYTDRPIRDDEEEGFEYYFTSHNGLLQKVYANDFIHLEKWGDFYSGIDTRLLKEVFDSKRDGLILASSFGASRLKVSFGDKIQPLYIWTGHKESLQNPRCLETNSPEIKELKWRIAKKIKESAFGEFEIATLTDDDFLDKRMVDNYLDIASVNGRLRSGEKITILPNLNNKLDKAVDDFFKIREKAKTIEVQIANRKTATDTLKTVDDKTKLFCRQLATRKANIFLAVVVAACALLWLSFIYLTEKYTWDVIEPKFSIATVPILSIAVVFLWFLISKRQLTLNPKEVHNAIVDYYEKKYYAKCGLDV